MPSGDSALRHLRGVAHAFVPWFFPFRGGAENNAALSYLFLRRPPRIAEISSIAGWITLIVLQCSVVFNVPFTVFGYRYFLFAFSAYFVFAAMILTFDLVKDYANRILGTYPFSELRQTLLTPRELVQAIVIAPLGLSVCLFTFALLVQSALVMLNFIRRIGYVPRDVLLQSIAGSLMIWLLGVSLAIYSSLVTLRVHLLFKSKFVAQARTLKRLPLAMSVALAAIPLLSVAVLAYVPRLSFEVPIICLALYVFFRMVLLILGEARVHAAKVVEEADDWWCCREGEPKLDEELEAMVPDRLRNVFFARTGPEGGGG